MRDLTEREQKILEAMLGQLPGVEPQLREQLTTARASQIDDEGSLRLDVTSPVVADIQDRVPVTATFDDTDNIPIYLLLHVIEGKLAELEIYKGDGSRIIARPTPERLYF
ncbi:MAG TPA: hypothetical protein VFC56_13675 [Stellaceae bacterium]|nr:hypothetical protein [Stellaceae bacterium]